MTTAPVADSVDFDLHGFVGVRIHDATPRDVATVLRQLGPLRRPLSREPDITVRFVDQIDDHRPLTYAGWPETGFTEDTSYLLQGRTGVRARTLLPFDAIGDRCDIVCERAVGPVPHLLTVVNLTALQKGVLPLHASAFNYRGVGVLATGWAKGGKTETLLAFAHHGASYIGDEWVYLDGNGDMYGVPEPIRLWHWHVDQLPSLRKRLPVSTRLRLAGLPALAGVASGLAERVPSPAASVLRRAAPIVRRQAFVQLDPNWIFGKDAVSLHGRLGALFLLASHDGRGTTLETVPAETIGQRMLASLEAERAAFLAHYQQFRFGQPNCNSAAVEAASSIEQQLVARLLAGRTAHVVRHPYPVVLESLVGPVHSVLFS
jgi:hypothetical protein